MTSDSNNLRKLGKLTKYEVAGGNPDVRGWKVIGADGENLGRVDELIVDPAREKVRYLDVDVDRDLFSGEDTRHVLVPVGAARLHEKEDVVLVNSLDRSRIRNFPVYQGGPISRDLEERTRDAIRNEGQTSQEHGEIRDPVSRQEIERRHQDDMKKHQEAIHSTDPMVKLKAERDIALAERDMARAELELMRTKLDNIGTAAVKGGASDYYDNDDYNADQFFASRRK